TWGLSARILPPMQNASLRLRLASLGCALLAWFPVTAVAATAPDGIHLHGIHPEDLDRSADACTDFYAFANGGWRSANPIPPSMQRWSRRWAAGEQSKDQLRTMLEDLGRRNDWPKGSVDQQITDFYGACMDEARVDALGPQPLAPLLARIHAAANVGDVAAVLADLHEMAIYPLFRLSPKPDNRDPSRVLARVAPAGLGLPDRDYY